MLYKIYLRLRMIFKNRCPRCGREDLDENVHGYQHLYQHCYWCGFCMYAEKHGKKRCNVK